MNIGNDRNFRIEALLIGVLFWACTVSSSPAAETNGVSNCASTNVTEIVAKKCDGKKAIYSRVLSVWRDEKTGKLNSTQVDIVSPPLLSQK